MLEITVAVEGMMCEKCEAHVKEALKEVKGVKSATADRVRKTAVVLAKDNVDREELKKAVEEAGYEVGDISEKAAENKGLFSKFKK